MTIELTLPTMTCGHCAKSVTAAVQRVDPQATLKIELPTTACRSSPGSRGSPSPLPWRKRGTLRPDDPVSRSCPP